MGMSKLFELGGKRSYSGIPDKFLIEFVCAKDLLRAEQAVRAATTKDEARSARQWLARAEATADRLRSRRERNDHIAALLLNWPAQGVA